MQITVQLDKGDAVRLGHNNYGDIAIPVDVAELSQDERDYLASYHGGSRTINMNLKYAENGTLHWQLFPPTTEGLRDLIRFTIEKNQAEKKYEEAQQEDRRLRDHEAQAKHLAIRDQVIGYLLTLGAQEFYSATSGGFVSIPGSSVSAPKSELLRDARLEGQIIAAEAWVEQWRRDNAERQRLEDEEAQRKQTAKETQMAAWISTRGTASQQRRAAANLLDEQEIIDAMRNEAFEVLSSYEQYALMKKDEVCTCEYEPCRVSYSSKPADSATETEFSQLEQIQKLIQSVHPSAVVQLRVHTGESETCENVVTRKGIKVSVQIGEFTFTREFGVIE